MLIPWYALYATPVFVARGRNLKVYSEQTHLPKTQCIMAVKDRAKQQRHTHKFSHQVALDFRSDLCPSQRMFLYVFFPFFPLPRLSPSQKKKQRYKLSVETTPRCAQVPHSSSLFSQLCTCKHTAAKTCFYAMNPASRTQIIMEGNLFPRRQKSNSSSAVFCISNRRWLQMIDELISHGLISCADEENKKFQFHNWRQQVTFLKGLQHYLCAPIFFF